MTTESIRDQLQSALTGRYAIERELGRGGMATVYLARDLRHDRLVALKLLNPELGAVLGAERFLSEIRVTANLQHPNLLPLFDSGEADGLLFYVMPYVEGESLRHRIERERQLPVDDAVRIAIAIAGALDYAHRRGIIHRDLKPENILLHEGQPLVADFGIALAVSNAGGQRVTQTGLSLGTPQYMSPEQASGDRVIDGRTDIYSLGAVAYEMLAGEPPHTGATPQAIMARLMTEEPRALTAVRRAVPSHVEAAIHRALEKLPADRFATGAELAQAMEGVGRDTYAATRLRGVPVAARRWKIATAVMSVVALAALGGLATMRKGSEERAKPIRARFLLELPDSARMSRAPGSMAFSVDGAMIAYLTREPGAALYVRRLDELMPRLITGAEGAANPAFSPDGRWIGFSVRNSLMKVPVEGGTPAPIVDSVSTNGFAWLDGGTIVFNRDERDGRHSLWKVSDAGGPAARLTTVAADEQQHRFPARIPGGKAALFAIQSGAGATAPYELATVRTTDGQVTRLGLKGSVPRYADGFLFFIRPDFTFGAVPFDARRARVMGEPINVAGSGTGDIAENGTMIMYPNAIANELVSVDRRGAARPLLGLSRAYYYPRLSPDGRRLAVGIGTPPLLDRAHEIWVVDLASGTLTRLSPDNFNIPNEWTPDGRRVIWTHGGGEPAVWSQPWDASAPAETVLASAQGAHFFPGGREFLTTIARPGGVRELRIVPLPVDTLRWSNPLVLRRAPGFAAARPSPDGKWIAYVDQQSGVSEVFLYARAGGRYQVSVGGGVEPVWNANGKELFYRAPQRGLMSAHLELGADVRVVKRDTLFTFGFAPGTVEANYDVTADGQHFIIPRPIAVSEWPIVVIGWTEELRDRMRTGGSPR